jgi:hypothetical protein
MARLEGHLKQKGGHKQEEALAALLVHPTQKAAAEACGIGLRTLVRWMAEDSFSERYQAAKRELVSGLMTEFRQDGSRARKTLLRIAEDVEAPAAAQVSAASKIVDIIFKQHENESIVERLDKWERERGNDGEKY